MNENFDKKCDSMCLKIGEKDCLSIFSGSKVRLLKRLVELVDKDDGLIWLATVNPEFVIEAKKDQKFAKILAETSINTADGIGIIWAERVKRRYKIYDLRFKKFLIGIGEGISVLRGKYRDRIAAGSELMVDLSKEAIKRNWKVFFLGGFGDTAEKAGEKINSSIINYELRYKTCEGRPRYNDAEVLLMIYKFRPEILFVAYGMKKQEEWIYEHKHELEKAGVRLVMGVGRSFDYYSGKLAMAPSWIKKMGLEWFFALINDPKRWKRDLKLIEFVWDVMRGTVTNRSVRRD